MYSFLSEDEALMLNLSQPDCLEQAERYFSDAYAGEPDGGCRNEAGAVGRQNGALSEGAESGLFIHYLRI